LTQRRDETRADSQSESATLGIIVVDHGSRREESNAMLLDVVEQFARTTGYSIVEPAHMELAEPSIRTAFARCVARGARTVVVHPYFLLPGKHWSEDIPALAAAAAAEHPGVRYRVTAPLGLHPLMTRVIEERIMESLEPLRDGEERPRTSQRAHSVRDK
jgi:sirohydrochlorin ferrochelatase